MDFNNERDAATDEQESNATRAIKIIMKYDVRVTNSIFRIKKFIKNAVMIQILFNLSCLVFILLLWQVHNGARAGAGNVQLFFLIKIACLAFSVSLVSWLTWGLWIVPRRIKKQRQNAKQEVKFIASTADKLERFKKVRRKLRKSDFN